jgi:porphobilinogen deaminase
VTGVAGTALRVHGLVASADGRTIVRMRREGREDDHPEDLGAEVARALMDGGGAAIEAFEPASPESGPGT